MIFIVIACISILIAFKAKNDVCTLFLCTYCSALTLTYGLCVWYQVIPIELGALRNTVNTSPESGGGEVWTSVMLLGLAALSQLSARSARPVSFARMIASIRPQGLRLYGPLKIATLALCFTAALIIVFTVNDSILAYDGYGALKDNFSLFADPVVRLVVSLFRPLVIVLIVFMVFESTRGKRLYAGLSLFPIGIGIVLGISQASRITSVYFIVWSFCTYICGRKILASLGLVASLALGAIALTARSHNEQGLIYFFDYVQEALLSENPVWKLMLNYFGGMLVTSSSIAVAHPDAYPEAFKILSLVPTVDVLDGFQAIKTTAEQRISSYIPFNSFSEAWLFGPSYFVAYWAIVGGGVLICRRSDRSPLLYLICLSLLVFSLIMAEQYPLRNSLRLVYLIYIIHIGTYLGPKAIAQVGPRQPSNKRSPRTPRLEGPV